MTKHIKMKLSDKILNQLRYGKTSNGKVGCKVRPTGANPNNHAWIVVEMKRGRGVGGETTQQHLIAYEVEYVELDESFIEDEHGLDFDLFLVKKEKICNLKTIEELEKVLRTWIEDFSIIRPLASVNYPC